MFAESYRRLLAPETLVLFELVDFAGALSPKEARKVCLVASDNRGTTYSSSTVMLEGFTRSVFQA